MQRAGFDSFMISPDQKPSETMLTNYQKGFSLVRFVQCRRGHQDVSLPVLWYFLIGGPGETNRTLQETLEFIGRHLTRKKSPPYNLAHIFLGVRIYPGTKLWQIALKEGFIHDRCNPLKPLWYLSRQLDLDETMRQLYQASCRWPEIALGNVEKFLPLTKVLRVTEKSSPSQAQPATLALSQPPALSSWVYGPGALQPTGVPVRLRKLLGLQKFTAF